LAVALLINLLLLARVPFAELSKAERGVAVAAAGGGTGSAKTGRKTSTGRPAVANKSVGQPAAWSGDPGRGTSDPPTPAATPPENSAPDVPHNAPDSPGPDTTATADPPHVVASLPHIDPAPWQESLARAHRLGSTATGSLVRVAHDVAQGFAAKLARLPANPTDVPAPGIPPTVDPPAVVAPLTALLINPPETGGAVHFLVDERPYTLQPGQSRQLPDKPSWFVQFHRGDKFGNAEYTITAGNYEFQVTENGWDLVPQL
jgi:hypothetical protein